MSPPRVSVIVTSYNYGQFIGQALESARDQTLTDLEVLILDDGSTDNSLEVIAPFLKDPRFRLIRQQHLGQPRTKNHGLALARAPFIAFLDADDLWSPDKLERQLARFDAEPDLGVVCCQRELIDPRGRPLPQAAVELPEGHVVDAMFRQNFVCFSSALLRAQVPDHIGRFDERIGLAIDYDFWLRAARHYRFGVVDAPLVAYRVGHVNLSRRQRDRLHVALLIMNRFRRQFDQPRVLRPEIEAISEAETFAHLGIIARGYSRSEALGWLARSLRRQPLRTATWRALAACLVPERARQIWRGLRGSSGQWEQLCYTPWNRPESIL